jgi:hypothetical protein
MVFEIIYTIAVFGKIAALMILLVLFVQDYRRVKSPFSLGLLVFGALLLFDSVMATTSYCPVLKDSGISLFSPIIQFLALVALIFVVNR